MIASRKAYTNHKNALLEERNRFRSKTPTPTLDRKISIAGKLSDPNYNPTKRKALRKKLALANEL